MALVSYGSNSDDSDYSEDEDGNEAILVNNKGEHKFTGTHIDKSKEDNISDEEEFFSPIPSGSGTILDEPEQPDLISLIAKKLPKIKPIGKAPSNTLLDEDEDSSSIPAKKHYGAKVEEPPSKKLKKDKAVGPVKITIPSLSDLQDDNDEEDEIRERIQPSKSGSGLFALLPQPKNRMSRAIRTAGINPALSNSQEPRQSGGSLSSNNLKPVAVRKVGLVPHRVANPIKPKPKPTSNNSDSDSEDDDFLGVGGVNSGSYFPAPAPPSNNKYKKVNCAPQAVAEQSYSGLPNPSPMPSHSSLPPTLPADQSFVSFNMKDDISPTGTPYQDLGPAVAPYPPPRPTGDTQAEQGGLVDNPDAILRLAGKANKRKDFKDDMNIIDLNEDDMKGDPLVWMTKAMTEEQAPRPTGKGPKGLAKTRHQITYLAHQAKEREWELKQDWATARENRRASANKYGF